MQIFFFKVRQGKPTEEKASQDNSKNQTRWFTHNLSIGDVGF